MQRDQTTTKGVALNEHPAPAAVDAALEFLKNQGEERVVSVSAGGVGGENEDVEIIDDKKLLRKIDWMIVPLAWACYTLQYLDKTLINYAAVMGIFDDANIDGNQFSYLAMAFYVSYLVFELPTGYLMQRFPLAKYLGANVIIWGVMVAVNCACKTFGSLMAVRVLLGSFESAVAPALILVTSMWYKKNEQPPRVGLWFSGTGFGTIIGALTSFGFQHYDNTTFASWQIMFLLFGLLTIVLGMLVMLFLPDNPMNSRLTRAEKLRAIERVRENQTGIENKLFKPYQMVECFRDPQTWVLSITTIASNVPGGAVGSYQATIIKGFGFTSKQTALLSIPSGMIAIVSVLSATLWAGRFNQRAFPLAFLLLLSFLGGCLLAFLPEENRAGKLAGNYLTNCIYACPAMLYSWVAANYSGHTKKVTMNAVILMSFCAGNIIGPLTFRNDDAPNYLPAKITIVVTLGVAIALVLLLRVGYAWENRRRDQVYVDGVGRKEDQEFLDLTDRENVEFRYQL